MLKNPQKLRVVCDVMSDGEHGVTGGGGVV